jgi:galactokinase
VEQAKLSAYSQQHFDKEPITVRAAGRINLIGEHTDYNNGFVLPAAIDKAIYLAIVKRNDRQIVIHALDVNDDYTGSLDSLKPTSQHSNVPLFML